MRKYAVIFVHGLAKKPPLEKLEETVFADKANLPWRSSQLN